MDVTAKLARQMGRTIAAHRLIAPGDRVMVAVSGGKDSYAMLDLLLRAQRKAPIAFEIVAVHLDQKQPGYDGSRLRDWLIASGARFEILERDTYSRVLELTPDGASFCGACSRLRRGTLYAAAERLGCNKIALGHHREDTLETLLMNLFRGGRLQAMPARYRTDDGRFEVIRPLIECAEPDIRAHAELAGYPIVPCNLCGSQRLERDQMGALLDTLERRIPDVKQVMMKALRNVRPSHLLDPEVQTAWAERAPNIRPVPSLAVVRCEDSKDADEGAC